MDAARFWPEIFGNDNPVEVEIGSGTGTFLLQASRDHPERNYFGVEHSRSHADFVHARLLKHGVANARIIGGDATCVLRHMIPPASVAAFHIYFPDPWWKRRHHRRRLFSDRFARDLARALLPGGYVHTATDVEEVFILIRETLGNAGAFVEEKHLRPPKRQQTSFERKGLARGALIREMSFRKR